MNERDTLDITLSEIAERAQANSALVKYYFGSKQGLMLALIERDVVKAMEQLDHLVKSDLSAVEKLRIHIGGLINTYYRSRYLNKLLFSLLRECKPAEAQDISDRLIKPAADAQRKILQQGLEEGVFRKIDPMLFYFTIIGACDQIFTANFALKTVFQHDSLDDDLRRHFVDHTTQLLLQGIMRDPKSDSR
jgi:TetR/AcrR family transcriptional regulator